MQTITKQARDMAEENGLGEEVDQAYINLVSAEYATAEGAQESYQGEYDSDEDFVMQLLGDMGELPDNLPSYIHIDWESTARDVMMDYMEDSGHYFRNL